MHANVATARIVVRAPAKVNLFLEVLAKRPDGYHELTTLMVAVNLYDTLSFEPNPSGLLSLTCNEPTLSVGEENLVSRAARLLQKRSQKSLGASIHLEKRIPWEAGLAGGSSDAASTLLGLNRLWDLGLSIRELAELGAELGSDVAFFFSLPAAWCTGRGEQVQPIRLAQPLWFVLVSPTVGLSTAQVFQRVQLPTQPRSGTEICQAVSAGDLESLGRHLHNRLQEPAEALCAPLPKLRSALAACSNLGVLMSGSGSSLFALCRDQSSAQRCAAELRTGAEVGSNPRVFIVQSCA